MLPDKQELGSFRCKREAFSKQKVVNPLGCLLSLPLVLTKYSPYVFRLFLTQGNMKKKTAY